MSLRKLTWFIFLMHYVLHWTALWIYNLIFFIYLVEVWTCYDSNTSFYSDISIINASRRWTPIPEINTNKKIAKKCGRLDGSTHRRTYYTYTQGIWPRGLLPHVLQIITGCANDCQKDMRTTGQRDREKDRRTYKIDREKKWWYQLKLIWWWYICILGCSGRIWVKGEDIKSSRDALSIQMIGFIGTLTTNA